MEYITQIYWIIYNDAGSVEDTKAIQTLRHLSRRQNLNILNNLKTSIKKRRKEHNKVEQMCVDNK